MELMVPIDNQSRLPLYEQIYQYMKEEIQSGRIPAGSRLPSTRILAENLKVSRSTTQMAYEQLLSEGYIEALPCKGYFVCRIEELVRVEKNADEEFAENRSEKEMPYAVDFSTRGIDLDSFPFNTWRRLSRNTLVDDNKEMFVVGDPQGEYELRAAIRDYLHSARGVSCRPEQILVGAGSEYLLMLLSQLLGRETGIALENPTYRQAYRVLKSLGHLVVPVKMDRYGMDVLDLEQSKTQAAYVMPSHQYPTGIVMPVKRRQELLSWAYRGENRYVIEDDYDSEFRYKGKPIPALQGYDIHERVIYLGTFSRSIAPALRMSYMVLPESLLCVYEREYRFINSTVSKIDQKIVERFLAEGYYERHLNRMRALYKSRHDTLLNALKPLLSIGSVSGEYAGVHLLFTFHDGRSEEDAVKKAKQGGIRIYGLSTFETQEMQRSCTILLGFANLPEEEIRAGAALLTEKLLE